GDAISVQNLPSNETTAAARRNVVREKFEFNTLRAPFSVGHGQFVLHNAAIEGPLVSATMLGKLDFRTRVLQVGGTFTPLSTLNKIFSEIPLVGDIVTGPKREGVFAMTYALQGSLENPELVVNPFSAITPGITRELMQITPSDPRIVPRKPPSGKNEKGARSSNSPAIGPRSKDSPSDGGGWSSDLNQNR
ncbi:MAG TPA: AsmA-like C-terminal region-containing protein, partial [Hyphomicrobiaceae bacterium]|nr:AsmA-like C-terminal region-containing protein [Hyphomicrobiaceae bacterium]